MQIAAQLDGFGQGPAAIGVEGHPRLREALGQGADRLDFLAAAEHAALELEVVEAITRMGRLGLANDGLGAQRFLVAHAEPGVVGIGFVAIAQVGLLAVADKEQVTEHLHRVALLAFAEQGRHRHAEVLAEQVEQRRLQGGDRMDGDAQVEGLQAAAAGVAVGEGLAHPVEQAVVVANGLPHQQGPGIFQGLADGFATGHLADADAPGVVLENQDIAGKEWAVGTTQVEQHAVVAGNRHNLQLGDNRGTGEGAGSVLCTHDRSLFVVKRA
ncbi:hypothetical protein D3C84_607530 [compost metagenome]